MSKKIAMIAALFAALMGFSQIAASAPAALAGHNAAYTAGYSIDRLIFKVQAIQKGIDSLHQQLSAGNLNRYQRYVVKRKIVKKKREIAHWKRKIAKYKRYSHPKTPKAVPEIDAAGAGIALALLAGVVGIIRERKRLKVA